jgi:Mg/Co/Ni transporter MgtE
MSDADPLNEDFAREFPDSFARVSARGRTEDIVAILASLPAEVAAAVAARMPASTMVSLMQSGLVKPEVWLADARFDDAIALLGHLPRVHALDLVDAMQDRTTRRRLRQFLSYPAHSVGALVSDAGLRFTERTPIGELLHELRALDGARPAIVLGEDGLYLGIVNLWRLALREGDNGIARDCMEPVRPLRPELPVATAVEAEQWRTRVWLPVVDHDRHVLGAVPRARVLESHSGESHAPPSAAEGLATLAGQFTEVAGDLLTRLLASRPR